MSLDFALQTAANSATVSVFYAIIAIGFTLVFGVMGVLNLAHGELYMVGAYVVWIAYAQGGIPFPLAIVLAVAIVAGLGLAMERGLFRPMRGRPLMGLIMSIGMIFILQVFVATTWHVGLMKQVSPYIRGSLDVMGISMAYQRLLVIPAAACAIGALWFFLRRTKTGQSLRAKSQDPEAAALQGISMNRVDVITMAIGAGLAGFAGAFMAPIMRVDPYMGHMALVYALLVTIVGGLGSIEGALIASFIYGFMINFVTVTFDSTMASIASVMLMFIVLAIRPRGIMGRA
ncbi:MAG: branched-chain amino acid ABC transporter permease [Dehalococcoidales bacterium]